MEGRIQPADLVFATCGLRHQKGLLIVAVNGNQLEIICAKKKKEHFITQI